MMTFMEVKGYQTSNGVNYVQYQTWSEESLMQVYYDDDDDDLHGGQRSIIVNNAL